MVSYLISQCHSMVSYHIPVPCSKVSYHISQCHTLRCHITYPSATLCGVISHPSATLCGVISHIPVPHCMVSCLISQSHNLRCHITYPIATLWCHISSQCHTVWCHILSQCHTLRCHITYPSATLWCHISSQCHTLWCHIPWNGSPFSYRSKDWNSHIPYTIMLIVIFQVQVGRNVLFGNLRPVWSSMVVQNLMAKRRLDHILNQVGKYPQTSTQFMVICALLMPVSILMPCCCGVLWLTIQTHAGRRYCRE
jgi:hypothetical protein